MCTASSWVWTYLQSGDTSILEILWHDSFSFIRVTWLLHTCAMNHSYVRHDSVICETWLIRMWDMTHSYVRHDSFICHWVNVHPWPNAAHSLTSVTLTQCLNDAREMTHSHVCHDQFTCITWLIHMVCLPHVVDLCVTRHSYMPLVGRWVRYRWLPSIYLTHSTRSTVCQSSRIHHS